ncbi:MAG: tRNA (N(6)-L-threonylcarbamoyladenosine(37)-C(2))-methylthiotransferase MtaB, partial [Bacteroidetes bacterium]|nr:tRNA (N(6)-L-threonylcarbamoyladenosine(37)-C(2))-methylthiotransferase MtaB [Bacteroidota bacterium]
MWYDQNKRVAFVCLGCKLNFAETSTWARTFTGHGYVRVSEHETADLYVVNTCSVTEQADKKCRQIIRHLHKIAPNARMVVTGCYAQLQAKELYDMEGVDMVIGSTQKADLFRRSDALMEQGVGGCYLTPVDQTTSFFPAYSSGDRTRSFLKVQDGCD